MSDEDRFSGKSSRMLGFLYSKRARLVELLDVLALQLVEDLAEEAAVHVLDVEADHGDLLHAEFPSYGDALLPVGDE